MPRLLEQTEGQKIANRRTILGDCFKLVVVQRVVFLFAFQGAVARVVCHVRIFGFFQHENPNGKSALWQRLELFFFVT